MTDKQLRWQLADLIDYECFLAADEKHVCADLDRRDQALYRDEIEPGLPPNPERRAILRYWVEARRRQERRSADSSPAEAVMPGEAFGEMTKEVVVVLALLAGSIGWWMAKAALEYSAGAEPINAFAFFVEFGATQMVVLVIAIAVFAARWWFPQWRIPSLLRHGLRVALKAGTAIWRVWRERNPERYQNARAMHGVLRARHSLYQGVLVWSAVGLAQLLVISFNGGVLTAMAARHLFHDLDFGWESTWLDASQVARGTRLIALPWSWAVHPGYPSSPQVAGSQNHKRDNGQLDADSLKSWSQFLFGAVVCYGLLPRMVLLLLAIRKQRTILNRLDFNDGRSELLFLRMVTPEVTTEGDHDESAPTPPPGSLSHPATPATASNLPPSLPEKPQSPLPVETPLIVDLSGLALTTEAIATTLRLANRWLGSVDPARVLVPDGENSLVAALQPVAGAAAAKVFVLLASRASPTMASSLSLDELRDALGRDRLITLILVGNPVPDGSFKPVQPAQRQWWSKDIQGRGDAFMHLLTES